MGYITTDQLGAYLKITSTSETEALQAAIDSASSAVDAACGRYFTDDGAVSARYFTPWDPFEVPTDDFSTTSGLIVQTDTGYNGTYGTTLTLNTDFFVDPVNQRVGSLPWPYTSLQSTGVNSGSFGYLFPPRTQFFRRPTVKITAQWGWASVPDPVVQATKVLAAEEYKLSDAPLGVAGFGEYGAVRVRENPKVRALLLPYMKSPVAVA